MQIVFQTVNKEISSTVAYSDEECNINEISSSVDIVITYINDSIELHSGKMNCDLVNEYFAKRNAVECNTAEEFLKLVGYAITVIKKNAEQNR